MNSSRILVVEDESIVALDIRSRLDSLGYELVGLATTGEQAVAAAEKTHPDLILMDIKLKGEMDGIEAADQILSCLDIPIIFLTAFADELTLERAKITEPFGYILKPFDERELSTNIQMALYKHQMQKKLKEREEYYRALIENSSDVISILDHNGIICYQGPSAERVLGYKPEEQIGKNVVEFLHPEDAPALLKRFAQAIQEQVLLKAVRYRFRHKDGSWRVLESLGCNRLDDPVVAGVVFNSRDITDRVAAEAALRESEERYNLAAQGANDGIWDWDLRTKHLYFSPRWKSMLGYQDGEIGNSQEDLFRHIHPDDEDQVGLDISAHLNGQSLHFTREHRMLHKDGSIRWVLTRGLAVRDSNGVAYRMAGSMTDITDQKNAMDQLQYHALYDTLTDLPNRALLMERLDRCIKQASRQGNYHFATLYLDLDSFKLINESLGHSAGDQLLLCTAHTLKNCLQESDTIARLASDEFVILMEEIHDLNDAVRGVERIQEELKSPLNLCGQTVFVSASIGIVLGHPAYETAGEMLRDASIAMYQAKLQGKSRFVVFRPTMRLRAKTRLEMESDLRSALERRELQIHYQPILSLLDNRVLGFEALARWAHPKNGFIPPAEFIPMAEESGQIIEIGLWVMHEACRQIKTWQSRFPTSPPLTISINVSVRQITYPPFIEQVEQALRATGLDARSLHLEITEGIFLENSEAAKTALINLHAMGIHIFIDDFGTGYSALSYLNSFPVDAIKIDRSFISQLEYGDPESGIVNSILRLADEMKIKVIAEGIETAGQLSWLRSHRCRYAQGYYFSKPMDRETSEKWLEKTLVVEV